jgi:FtsP/CotA-like multicopper oxidase with cupredoxin domain/peroxiredoxin
VNPRSTQEYEIKIPDDHVAGTFWYHAHRHGSTGVQVGSGMSGALIIEGGMDEIPEIAAADERVFVLQQIPYAYKNKVVVRGVTHDFTNLEEGVIEAEQADVLFAAGVWANLGRFTTINGDRLPVIRVRPGSVERWRFVHSGTRQEIFVGVERFKGGGDAPEKLPLHEIARDGIPLGRAVSLERIDLYPGYRSDALFKAPDSAGCEYFLIDDAAQADASLTGQSQPKRYLARIVVEGDSKPMSLPADAQLAAFLPPALGEPTEVKDSNTVDTLEYGFPGGDGVPPNPVAINGKLYDHNTSQQNQIYKLGDIVERKLRTGSPFIHVFHIHVNPFQIVKVTDRQGQVVDHPDSGAWRDTLALRPGEEATIRMKIDRFTGLFVQHCHILEHEDLGMMDLVQIDLPDDAPVARMRVPSPYLAPALELPGVDGAKVSSRDMEGRRTILVFYKGTECLPCHEQLAAFARRADWFREHGVDLVAVSTDDAGPLGESVKAAGYPFAFAADPGLGAFRKFGCVADIAPLHGVFVLDESRRVLLQSVSVKPMKDVDGLLDEVESLFPARVTPAAEALSRR